MSNFIIRAFVAKRVKCTTAMKRVKREVNVGEHSLRIIIFGCLSGSFGKLYVLLRLFWNKMEIHLHPYIEIIRRNPDTAFLTVSALIMFLFKWNHLFLPFFWDEIQDSVIPLHNLYVRGFRQLLIPGGFSNHSPGPHLLIWPVYVLFGESIFTTRLLMLISTIFSVYFTYKLGREFHSKTLGIVASCTLFFSPCFFAMSDMYMADVLLTCFATVFVYFVVTGQFIGALIAGIMMGLMRESSIAFGAGALLFIILRKQLTVKWVIVALTPFLFVGLFVLQQKLQTGVVFNQQAFVGKEIQFSMSALWSGVLPCLRMFFWDFNMQIFIIIFIISLSFLLVRRLFSVKVSGFKVNIAVTFGFIMLIFIVFFSFYNGVHPVHLRSVMPFFLILTLYPIVAVVGRVSMFVLPCLVWFFFGQYYGINTSFGTGHEYSMEHVDVIEVFKRAAKYVEEIGSDKVIFARWPIREALKYPYLGYVNKPMELAEFPEDGFDIYVWSNNTDYHTVHEKESLIGLRNMKMIKKFKYRGKNVEIYGQ